MIFLMMMIMMTMIIIIKRILFLMCINATFHEDSYLESRKIQRLKVVCLHKLDYDVYYLSHNSNNPTILVYLFQLSDSCFTSALKVISIIGSDM